MKRYSMEIDTPNRIVIIPYEDENGEWVRYEDVEELIIIGNQLANELESEIKARYEGKLDFPVMKRKMEQDMASIKKWNSKGGGMKRYKQKAWKENHQITGYLEEDENGEWVKYADTQKVCEWKEKTTNIFDTKCKNAIYTDWTSDFEYCPFCGGKIELVND